MRQAILAAMLFAVPMAAWAEQPPPPPNVQALQQTIIELTGDKLDWRTQAIALQAQLVAAKTEAEAAQAQLADLHKQLAAQAKPQEPRP